MKRDKFAPKSKLFFLYFSLVLLFFISGKANGLDIISDPNLDKDKFATTIKDKYTNGIYTSEKEPSVFKIYKYCIDELLLGLPIRLNRFYFRKNKYGPNLIKKVDSADSNQSRKKFKKLIVKNKIEEKSIKPKITWFQHASFLIQINNVNILVDPVFYNSSRLYPCNFEHIYKPEDLPQKIDVILISHNHSDHMDMQSLHALKKHSPNALVCVPVGNGNKVKEKFKFTNVYEFKWQNKLSCSKDDTESKEITFTFLPAIHWSSIGLGPKCMNTSHWGSWMISSKDFNVYFSGDTFYNQKLFKKIRKQFPNMDVAIMGISPNRPWKSVEYVHLNAKSALQAFIDLDAKYFIPMHWGTYRLGTDYFSEPLGRLISSWEENIEQLQDKRLCILPFGGNTTFPSNH